MVLVENWLFQLKYSKYQKLWHFIFPQKCKNNAKNAKKCKRNFGILVQTASIVGPFWIIEKITPKSASLSLTILYPRDTPNLNKDWFIEKVTKDSSVLLLRLVTFSMNQSLDIPLKCLKILVFLNDWSMENQGLRRRSDKMYAENCIKNTPK